MTREEAMKLMVETGFQDVRKAERRTSAQFDLKAYLGDVLSFGSPPVRLVRALLLDEPIR
jgi:hypothetical protein